MANGDDAVAAGMAAVASTADRRLGYDEINKTRDYIAQRTSAVTTVAKGGTGATTAAAARTNLDVSSTADTAYYISRQVHNTGADTNQVGLQWVSSRLRQIIDGTNQGDLATVADVNARIYRGGDTMTGDLFLPNSSAATSSYTVAYINGDGRVSRGASSERYKKQISQFDPMALGDLHEAPFVRFRMKADSSLPNDGSMPADPTWRYGYIAESLIGTDMEGFVVVIDGQVESIDFIGLLLAQTAQHHVRLLDAEARYAALEARVAALETRLAA